MGPIELMLRRKQMMLGRLLSGVSLTLAVGAATAIADDGWRPAGSQPVISQTSSPETISGSLGVSLGRPVGIDESIDRTADRGLADSNLTRTSYAAPSSLPSIIRSQSPEVAQPLPAGPLSKSSDLSASSVSRSTSGFASGGSGPAESSSGIFASDQGKPDAPLEAVPAPRQTSTVEPPSLAPDPMNADCSNCSAGAPCRNRIFDRGCCDECNSNRFYLSGEYLLWWIKNSHTPPLVTTGPAGSAGVIGAPGTVVLFGGSLENEERSGGRFTAGYWFDNCQTLALETSVFFLANRNENFSANSGVYPLLARPFFNLNTGSEFSEITTSPGLGTGSIGVNTYSRLWGAEANLRYNICDNCRWRFDVLGGFRYLNLREGINIQENIMADAAAGAFAGDTILVNDDFNTRNQFYGGQIGTRLGWTWNRWSIDWLAKVALGDTHQVVNIQGNQLITTPAGATSFFNGGLLALGSNSGSFSRDHFTVVPETDLILGFRVTNHMKLLVGYSFLYWSDVARPGNQIDRVIDVTKIPNSGLTVPPTGANRPAPLLKGTDFWAQGLSFGIEFVF
jgi:hypothetical protein